MTTGSMTTGNRFLDRNGIYAGSWTSRSWSGGDRSSGTRISLSGMSAEDRRLLLYNARRVKRAAPFEPHDYSCTILDEQVPLITYWNKLGNWGSTDPQSLAAVFGYPTYIADPWTDNHHLNLVAKLRDKVVGGGLNVAVSVAEMSQTARFIGDVARRVAKLDKSFKKLVSRKYKIPPTKVVRGLRDDWLAYQYAVQPLLGDVKNACQTLATINNRKHTQRFVVRDEVSESGPGHSLDYWSPGTAVTRSGEQIIAFIFDGPNALLDASGILDPASVLWEKIPFSFVADWFLPVGDFLKAVSFWRAYEGQFIVTRKVVKSCSGFGGSGRIYAVSGGTLSRSTTTITRTVSTDIKIPYPRAQGLGSLSSDLRHAISGVALLLPNGWVRR